ncbi:MAG: hypothetical protein R3E01_07180 [Pirellulaceae bacterium]|nr:hypothetical protein [Planctomycetales bacterium]
MEARLAQAALLCALFFSLGADYRTTNFVVTAPSPQLAKEVGDLAEVYRSQLAVQWLGQELPQWPQPCPVRITHVGPNVGAGGATSFMFDRGRPFGWEMSIQGSRERILDSVLPHEVNHTIFATHFGGPLPRWADEGACTTVEDASERRKQDQLLYQFLTTGKGIAFNKMFAMKEYPPEVLPLYAQGYSLTRYLLQQGGHQRFVQFVGYGMQSNNWDAAISQYYGYRDLSELQVTWLEWVRGGSQAVPQRNIELAQQGAVESVRRGAVRLASAAEPLAGRDASRQAPATSASGGSWYAKQRNAPQQVADTDREIVDAKPTSPNVYFPVPPIRDRPAENLAASARVATSTSRPQPPQQMQTTVLQWSSPRPAATNWVQPRKEILPETNGRNDSRRDTLPLSEGGRVWR